MGLAPLLTAAMLTAAPAAALPDDESWGALAYSPSSEVNGYAQRELSEADAKAAALGQCEMNSGADDCAAVTFRNGCGAIAVGRKGWRFGTGADEDAASAEAVKACKRRTKDCDVQTVHCSP